MFLMLYRPFEEDFPVRLCKLTDEQIEQVPFMQQVLQMMTLLSASHLKLTVRGYIPPKSVEDFYLIGESADNSSGSSGAASAAAPKRSYGIP